MQALHRSTCTALSIADAHTSVPPVSSSSPLHAPALATSCVLVQHYCSTYAYCLVAGQLWCCLLDGIVHRDRGSLSAAAQWHHFPLPAPARQLAVVSHKAYNYLLYLEEGGRVVLLQDAEQDAARGDRRDEPHVTPRYVSGLAGPVASLYNARDGIRATVAVLYESGRAGLLTWPRNAMTPIDYLIDQPSLAIPEPVQAITVSARQSIAMLATGRSTRSYYLREQGAADNMVLHKLSARYDRGERPVLTGISLGHSGGVGQPDLLWMRQADGHWRLSTTGLVRGVPAYSWAVQAPTATFLVAPTGRLLVHDGTRARPVSWSWHCRESAWLWEPWSLPRRRPCADGRFAITSLAVWHGMSHQHGSYDSWCNVQSYLVLLTRCGHLVEALVCPTTGAGEIRRVVPVAGRG